MDFSNVSVADSPCFPWCIEGKCIVVNDYVRNLCTSMDATIIPVCIHSDRIKAHVTLESIIEKYKDYNIIVFMFKGNTLMWTEDTRYDTDTEKFHVIRMKILDDLGNVIRLDCSDL